MNLKQRDRKHLWHPLTQHKSHPEHLPIVKAEGVWLFDEEGNKYIDGISSWYTCMYGHCNPLIIEKIRINYKHWIMWCLVVLPINPP